MARDMKPILLIGGHGATGRMTSRILRERYPALPLVIGGRDVAAAELWAMKLGRASALRVDLDKPDLGLAEDSGGYSAVIVLGMDEHYSAMAYAKRHAIPYICVTGGAFETGSEFVMAHGGAPQTAIILAPHWFCGAAMLPAIHLADSFAVVDRIAVAILIDRNGRPSGAATTADFQRIDKASKTMLVRKGGKLQWISRRAGTLSYHGVAGRMLQGLPAVSIDVASLAAASAAPDIHVLETWGDSASFQRGEQPTDEIVIELTGTASDGAPLHIRQEIVASRGVAPLTANMIAMLTEAAAGLGDFVPLAPGVYTPEHILDPGVVVRRLAEAGAVFTTSVLGEDPGTVQGVL